MGRMTKKNMPPWAKTGHAKPVTRRDFLAHGLIPFAASALVPGALGLLTGIPKALADEITCPADSSALATFITLNLNGGASLSSNYLPRDAGGQLLPSYSKMGGGTAANLTTTNDFGVNAFVTTSPLLAGLKTVATTATLNNTAFVGVCVQSQDDNSGNKFDASGMVFKAGAVGSMLPNLGTVSTTTGMRQDAATLLPPPPLVVKSFNDLANSIGYTAALKTNLTQGQRSSLTQLVQNLSASQTRKLASISSTAQVQSLVECAGIRNTSLISQGATAVDPVVQSPEISAVWKLTAATAATTQNRIFGSMIYNALAGKAGTVNLDLGGYDYHDNTRTTGDAKDNAAGVVIGQILESARVMNKPVFLYVVSDGSVVSTASDTPGSPWTSDRGAAGSAMLFMYNPNGRPVTTGQQIGNFTTGQVADPTFVSGASAEVASQAVFANYLRFNGKDSLFSIVAPTSVLTGKALTNVIQLA